MSTTTNITHPDGTIVSVTTTTSGVSASGSLGQLIYFPVYAKGLQLALAAEMSGQDWEGITTEADGPNSWKTIKGSGIAPFGQMPLLKTPSGLVIAQSTAIANYIGKKAGMLGSTDEDFALSQMCMAEAEDIYSMMGGADLASWKKPEVRMAKAVR